MGGQIQQNGGLGGNHHQGQDTKPRQVTSVQVRRGLWSGICTEKVNLRRWKMFNCFQRSLPAYARVKQSRVPNAYDKTALRLEVHIKSLDSKNPCAVGVGIRTFFCWKKPPLIPHLLPGCASGCWWPPLLSSDPILSLLFRMVAPSLVIIKHHYFAAGLFDDLAPGNLKWQHLFLFKSKPSYILYAQHQPTKPFVSIRLGILSRSLRCQLMDSGR